LKVFVTGGAGFIGSKLCEVLDDFYVFDKKLGNDIRRPVDVWRAISRFKPDVIVHLVAMMGTSETFRDEILTTKVNVLGTLHVLEAARKIGAKVIYASKPHLWRNPYTITKSAAEEFVQMFHEAYGLETVVLRLYNVYGPGLGLKKAIPIFITHALKNKTIHIYGNGKQSTDWIYLDDVLRAFQLAIREKNAVGQWMDIGTGTSISVNNIVKLILKLTGSKSKVEYLPMRVGEGPERYIKADISKATRLLGFRASVRVREGLQNTIEYWRTNLEG